EPNWDCNTVGRSPWPIRWCGCDVRCLDRHVRGYCHASAPNPEDLAPMWWIAARPRLCNTLSGILYILPTQVMRAQEDRFSLQYFYVITLCSRPNFYTIGDQL